MTPSPELVPEDVPFAAPLLAVDRVTATETDGGFELRAWKLIDQADPYLAAHFPGFAIFPGVFVIESLRQAVALGLGARDGEWPDLIAVRSARFLSPLLPGDVMALEASVAAADANGVIAVEAVCRRGDAATVAGLKVELRYGGPAGA